MSENKNQQLITSHAVLIGLTPFIPIPFVDDLAKSYFQRRMVRKIAASYGFTLESKDIKTLADDESGGCLSGCLGTILLYPLAKIFRKIFFFLEFKRVIDTVSRAYHHGFLIDHMCEQGWQPPHYDAKQMRAAIDATLKETGTKPIENAVGAVFSQSKDVVKNAAEVLRQAFERLTGKSDEQTVAAAAESAEAAEEREITTLTTRLDSAFASVPPDYFQRLRARLAKHLKA